MGIIHVGHTNCLIMVEIVWPPDPKFSLMYSWRLPTSSLSIKQIINMAHTNFKLEICRGLKIYVRSRITVAHTNGSHDMDL